MNVTVIQCIGLCGVLFLYRCSGYISSPLLLILCYFVWLLIRFVHRFEPYSTFWGSERTRNVFIIIILYNFFCFVLFSLEGRLIHIEQLHMGFSGGARPVPHTQRRSWQQWKEGGGSCWRRSGPFLLRDNTTCPWCLIVVSEEKAIKWQIAFIKVFSTLATCIDFVFVAFLLIISLHSCLCPNVCDIKSANLCR